MESKWYTVRVQSNREKFVSEKIKAEYARMGVDLNVLVPMEKQFFLKAGKKAYRDKVTYPGYIFIKSDNQDLLQDTLRLIPGNTGLLKNKSGEPAVLKQIEIDKMLSDDEVNKSATPSNTFLVGETVKILGGPFDSFKGKVEEINKEKSKVKVHVSIFGRITPVDLNLDQIDKIQE